MTGVGVPPSAKRSGVSPASRIACRNLGRGRCIAPTLRGGLCFGFRPERIGSATLAESPRLLSAGSDEQGLHSLPNPTVAIR